MNCAVTIKSEKLRALLMACGGVKVKRKLFSVSLVLIFLILISTVASAEQYIKIGNGSEPAIDDSKVT